MKIIGPKMMSKIAAVQDAQSLQQAAPGRHGEYRMVPAQFAGAEHSLEGKRNGLLFRGVLLSQIIRQQADIAIVNGATKYFFHLLDLANPLFLAHDRLHV